MLAAVTPNERGSTRTCPAILICLAILCGLNSSFLDASFVVAFATTSFASSLLELGSTTFTLKDTGLLPGSFVRFVSQHWSLYQAL